VVGPAQRCVLQGQFAQFDEDCIEGVREEMFNLFDSLFDRMEGVSVFVFDHSHIEVSRSAVFLQVHHSSLL
jgi:hypothetical protein